MFKLFPNSTYLADPLIAVNGLGRRRTVADYYKFPLFRWLVDNVGEIGNVEPNEWISGNGWEVGYEYNNGVVEDWKTKHYIRIRRKDIDPKLLTEFALRFS